MISIHPSLRVRTRVGWRELSKGASDQSSRNMNDARAWQGLHLR